MSAEKLPACPLCGSECREVPCPSPPTLRTHSLLLLAEQAAKARAWDAMERSASEPPITTATSFAIVNTMRSYLAIERKRGGLT